MSYSPTTYKANDKLRKTLDRVSYVLSALVLLLVGLMRRVKVDVGIDFSFLPPVHASFNVIVAICLIMALIYIKRNNVEAHKKAIFGAMIFSALFLLSYVAYHFTTEETRYCFEGTSRTIYFILLISHIILAGVSLPFILLTFSRGISFSIPAHRRMARIVYPIWLYVAISGPLCYLMLRPCYA